MPSPKPPASSAVVLQRMQRQRRRDTAPEVALRAALHRAGCRFRVDFKLPKMRRTADIAFPRLKVAVFVDGCFWHGCPEHATWPKENAEWWRTKIEENRSRDRDTEERLRSEGWEVVRVWEHEEVADAAARVRDTLAASPRTSSATQPGA